jgi:hypothetical protein
MNEQQIQGYITIAQVLIGIGIDTAQKFKAFIQAIHPHTVLTDEQINAIEQAGILDSQKRQAEREAMGQ